MADEDFALSVVHLSGALQLFNTVNLEQFFAKKSKESSGMKEEKLSS